MARTTIPPELVAVNAIQGTLIADNSVTAVHIATNAISGTLVADNAITSTHIAQNNVTATQIAQNTITVTQMADSAIETAKINADAVTGAKIADNAIDSEHYTDGSIDTAHIADSQITAAKIGANAVTLAKMASLTRGSILVGNSAADVAALAIGSNGTALVSDGTDVSWGSAGVAGISSSADATAITIDSSEKVGIGTATLNKIFNIADPAQGGETLKLHFEAESSADKWAIYSYDRTNGHYADLSFGGNYLYLKSGGNVGIGTTNPAQKLHVSGGSGASTLVQFGEAYDTSLYIKATNTASAMLRFQNASDTVKYAMGYRNDSNAGPFRIRAAATLDSGGHKWDFDAAGTFHIIPNNTAALLNLTASGTGNDSTMVFATALNARGIYVDDSDTNKMKFYTGYGKAANREFELDNNGNISIYPTRNLYLDNFGDTYLSEYSANEFEIVTGNSRKFALSGGNLYHTGSINSNHNFSDERLKENIVVIPNALEKVNSLRGITFTRKDDGSVGTGLIAQELEKVLPEAVYDSKTIDSLENSDAEEYKAINYGNTVGLLVEAIKELEARIKTLEG